MEVNFRLILIIISAIVIIGIYFHGRSKIHKGGKNPIKLKSRKVDNEVDESELERNFDPQGFDQVGVSKPRPVPSIVEPDEEPFFKETQPPVLDDEEIVTKEDIAQFEQSHTQVEQVVDLSVPDKEPSIEPTLDEVVAGEPVVEQAVEVSNAEEQSEQAPTIDAPVFEEPVFEEPVFIEPVFEEPVIDKAAQEPVTEPIVAEREVSVKAESKAKPKPKAKRPTKAELKRDQMALDFDDEISKKEIEQEVLALSVVVADNQMIPGAALLPSLLTLGLKFGDMDIFHRHEDNAGNGKITFSLANMVNPGTFNLDNMENFSTKGITLFMTLPNAQEPAKVFKKMLSAAKQVADEFGGQVLDGQRSVMTKQTEQHYLTRIREFDRKCRLAGY